MMTVCRYACAVVVFLVVSLTPRSCSDVSEPAMAADEATSTVVSEKVHTRGDVERLHDQRLDVAEVNEIGS